MFVNLNRGGKLGQYFSKPYSELNPSVGWLKDYVGFSTVIGQAFNSDGEPLNPEDVIQINTFVYLYPPTDLILTRGVADQCPSDYVMDLGVLVYRWRLNATSKNDQVGVGVKVNKKTKVSDLLGQPLVDVYVYE
jgi:hypothetical protein